MKIRITVSRESGPIIGSQLVRDYQLTEPEIEELRLPRTILDDRDAFEASRVQARRQALTATLASSFAREFLLAIEKALDGEHPLR